MTDHYTTPVQIASILPLLDKNIDRQVADLASWADKFKDNPTSALEWADDTFKNGARLRVSQQFKGHLEWLLEKGTTEVSGRELQEVASKQLLDRVTRIGHSTSTSSNHMEKCIVEAWGEAATGRSFGSPIFDAYNDVLFDHMAKTSTYVAYKDVDMKEGRKKIGTTKVFADMTGSVVTFTNSPEHATHFNWDQTQDKAYQDFNKENGLRFMKKPTL